jgi:hypothetical protein
VGWYTFVTTKAGPSYLLTDAGLVEFPFKLSKNGFLGDLVKVGDVWWVGSSDGVFMLAPHKKAQFFEGKYMQHVFTLGNHVWAAGEAGAWVMTNQPLQKIRSNVNDVVRAGKEIWLATDEGVYRITDSGQQEFVFPGHHVMKISVAADDLWFSVLDGQNLGRQATYRFHAGSTSMVLEGVYLRDVIEHKGRTWLGCVDSLYELSDGKLRLVVPEAQLQAAGINQINRLFEAAGDVWIEAIKNGALSNLEPYRIDEDVTLGYKLENINTRWGILEALLPSNWLVEGSIRINAEYRDRNGRDPYPIKSPRAFHVLFEEDKRMYDKRRLDPGEFDVAGTERYVPAGRHIRYISVRDRWGSQRDWDQGIVVAALPAAGTIAGAIFFIWFALLISTLILAPYSSACMGLLMNPWLRTWGSFGAVPLLLSTIPILRRHILRAYVNGLKNEYSLSNNLSEYVVPAKEFEAEQFLGGLARQRVIMLIGEAGLGKTSFLRYLQREGACRPRHGVPVLVLLRFERQQGVDQMLAHQLELYGGITDASLALWFIKQGGFTVLVDGLNEISAAERQTVATHLTLNYKINPFCITSQIEHPAFENWKVVRLQGLTPPLVDEAIRKRLSDADAKELISRLDPDVYELCSVPHDLECLIRIRRQVALPRDRVALYAAVIRPLYDAWAAGGHDDYPALLEERAFEMLAGRQQYFLRKDNPLPAEVRDALVRERLLVLREESEVFAHNLIRAYLASRYFLPQWKELLNKPDTRVNAEWVAMLRLSLMEAGNAERGDLLMALLKKAPVIAGVLYETISRVKPDAVASFQESFLIEFAKATLSRGAVVEQ